MAAWNRDSESPLHAGISPKENINSPMPGFNDKMPSKTKSFGHKSWLQGALFMR
jgi:hypothetical protein